MAEQAQIAVQEADNAEDDVRRAIEELKIETPSEPRVVVDRSSAEDRARDAEGKFAKKPEEPKERKVLTLPEKDAGVKADGPLIGVPAVQAEGTPPPVASTPAFKAPESWKADVRGKFNDLPPEVQAEIIRRENDITKGLSKQDEDRSFGRKVNEIVSPYLPTIRAEGGTPEKAIQELLQTAHTLRQGTGHQKASAVAQVIRQFGVDANDLFSILQGANVVPGNPAQQGQQFDPRYESLQQRLDRMEQERQQEIQQRQTQERESTLRQIEEFAAKPGHEHFEKVRAHMGREYDAGVSTDLEELYQRACYADPEIRVSLIAAQQQASQGQRLTEQNAKTERARNAAVSVVGGPGGANRLNGHANPNSSIEDDLRAAIRELDSRV